MKSIIALAAVLALVSSVEAAPSKATTRTAKAKASKGVRVAAVKKNVSAGAAAETAALETTETAKLSDVKPAAPAKKWSFSAYNETYGAQIKSTNNGSLGKKYIDSKGKEQINGGITSDNGVKLGYKVADTVTVSGAVEWEQTYGTREADAKATMYDPSIRIAKSDLADLGNGVGLSGQARVYLPVSEASQDKEQIAQIRFYATAERAVSKALTASFTLNPRIFAQQNDTYINAAGETKNLDTFRLHSYAGLKYAFNDMVAVEQTFGIYQKWRTNTARADFLDASSSVYVAPVSWLELNLGVRQIDGATDARVGGFRGLYSADQAEYYLITSFSI